MSGRSLVRRVAARLLRATLPRPETTHGQLRVAIAPEVTDADELTDIVSKARFFFAGLGVRQVFIPASAAVAKRWAEQGSADPDYAVSTSGLPPLEVIVFDAARTSPIRAWTQANAVFVWDNRWLDSSVVADAVSARCKDVDRHRGQWDGWAWSSFASAIQGTDDRQRQILNAQQRFVSYVDSLPPMERAYVFGTGPSLELARERDFTDGYRIVCNTIVRNEALIEHLAPHFIVAGDAIYHYGNTRHAAAFRADAHKVLAKYDTRLLMPDMFYPLFVRDHPEVADKVIPVDTTTSGIFLDLKSRLAWTSLENVLNGLLLPLGSSLANEVCLLGFDGRSPGVEQFWTNSSENSYPELKKTIQAAHPGFFGHMDYEAYADAQSAGAERLMAEGERLGKRYIPLHPTHIPALRRRMTAA